MSVTKQEMISFFSKHYPGDVQTRGLWLWADGDAKDIPYSNPPEKHWTELWEVAEKEEMRIVPQNLIQEALLDAPGDKFLINCLNSLSQSKNVASINNARLIVEIFERWGGELEFDSILASLLIFSGCQVRQGVTVLVPVLDRKIDEELRDKWEPWFQKIKNKKITGSVKGIYSLLDLMLDSLMKNSPRIDSEKFHVNASKTKAHLEKVLKGLEDLPEDDIKDLKVDLDELRKIKPNDEALLNALIKELMPLIGSFVEINPKTLKPISHTAFTGIQRIFELSKIISGEKKWPWVNDSAEIYFKTIWSTQAKKTEDETAKNS